MIKRWHEPMQKWSRERGLEFHPDGLLPAWTRVLAKGAGAGAHRASLVISQSDSSQTSTGGFTKYPERGHHHLCRGVLPGGVEGVVAHQLHLALDSSDEGESWHAFPTTVVVARLPAGARVAQDLTARRAPRPGRVKPLQAAALRRAAGGVRRGTVDGAVPPPRLDHRGQRGSTLLAGLL